ncbi:MAG: gluconate 2-dehydrogenase subunit 3 family protein [Bryobacteraceae bacterium]
MNRRDLLKLAPAAALAQPAAPWKPQLFDDHQNETVVALSDLIIPATDTPGAKLALVNRHLDRLLHDGPAAAHHQFLEGLAALDGLALRTHQQPFVRCTEAQRTALLEALDQRGDSFFRRAKALIAQIYYSTEIGFKELNKGGRVPQSFGCEHGGHA